MINRGYETLNKQMAYLTSSRIWGKTDRTAQSKYPAALRNMLIAAFLFSCSWNKQIPDQKC